MQPLYSVDHETRHNASHTEVENVETPSEETPLIRRFTLSPTPRNPVTTVIVSLLLLILVSGVIIGIYLLVLQNASENVLPPVDQPLQLVSRSQWDTSILSQHNKTTFPYRLRDVTVVQTGTNQCYSTESCTKLLQEMQANATFVNATLPYNFLISSNGQTYEALGWQKPSSASKQSPPGLLLAYIGNFSKVPPTRSQSEQAKKFFAASVSQQYLHPTYRILGKNVNDTPIFLRENLQTFPQWSSEYTDRQ